jgi:hypothetical protein
MTPDEQQERREARYHGARCTAALRHFSFHQGEANQWRALDGHSGHLTVLWQERADRHATDAYEQAVKAAHHARLAQQGRTEKP